MMGNQKMIEEGYEPTNNLCAICEEGSLWINSFETVCDSCNTTWRKEDIKDKKDLTKVEFYEDRPKDNNGNIIPQGGFFQAYEDWNPTDENNISNKAQG